MKDKRVLNLANHTKHISPEPELGCSSSPQDLSELEREKAPLEVLDWWLLGWKCQLRGKLGQRQIRTAEGGRIDTPGDELLGMSVSHPAVAGVYSRGFLGTGEKTF